MRAVVDTNVWVSALLNPSGSPARVLEALRGRQFTLVVSPPMLDELAEVLARPRIARKYGITTDDVRELLDLLRERAELAVVTGAVRICRDPDDDMVIETALAGKADVLVTRDDDLKAVSPIPRVDASARRCRGRRAAVARRAEPRRR